MKRPNPRTSKFIKENSTMLTDIMEAFEKDVCVTFLKSERPLLGNFWLALAWKLLVSVLSLQMGQVGEIKPIWRRKLLFFYFCKIF